MMTLELDDETAILLIELAELEHLSPVQLLKKMLPEHLEDYQDAKQAELAYQRYMDGGKVSHDVNDVVKELGLDNTKSSVKKLDKLFVSKSVFDDDFLVDKKSINRE
ncbi:MAG: hypothetical protein EXR80_05440 [Methylococcales bacterium]|nr:hypothetical protein [Methylococcales bacterium]